MESKPCEVTCSKVRFLFSSILLSLASFTPSSQAEADISPYIINGDTASTQTYPYMAILIINRLSEPSNSVESFCGGTLINEQYVLTAAHCLYTDNPKQYNNLEVVFNVDNIRNDIFDRNNSYAAKEVYYHDGYQPDGNFENDIAVIKLMTPVGQNVVSSADYVELARDEGYRTDGQQFTVIGYGKTGPYQGGSDSLQAVQVEYVQPDQCAEAFLGSEISDHQICVSGKVENNLQSGACGGDSGGPLLYRDNGRYYQVGIVSFGPAECGNTDTNIQSVYTEVNDYQDNGWLASVLNGTAQPKYNVTQLKKTTPSESSGGGIGFGWAGLLMVLALMRQRIIPIKLKK